MNNSERIPDEPFFDADLFIAATTGLIVSDRGKKIPPPRG
jgi:hypothetical protein